MSEIIEEKNIEVKQEQKKKKESRAKDKISHTGILKFFQHILLTAALVSFVILVVGSTVVVNGSTGAKTYSLSTSDEGRPYEDSLLINTIMGNEISEIIRYVNIKSELETNGIYDPDKVISININQNNSFEDNSTTISYRIGDLIKWTRYGFEWQETSNVNSLSISANSLFNDSNSDILVNRYKTVDGHYLEDYASNLDEYYYLTNLLTETSNKLYNDYSEYLILKDYYVTSNSNMRFCIIEGKGKTAHIYSNVDVIDISDNKLDSMFEKYGKYITYDSNTMIYKTNTAINESTFNSLMSENEVSFWDNCKVYIACDLSMPANDGIKAASKGYNNYLPYYVQLICIISISTILYLILLVVCTIKEGRVVSANGTKYTRLNSFDDILFEIVLAFGLILAMVPIFLVYLGMQAKFIDLLYTHEFKVLFGICIFIYDFILLSVYYSIVRRIKANHIWKYSFTYKLINAIKNGIYYIYDNGTVALRSIVPYVIVILVNFIVIFAIVTSDSVVLFWSIILLIIDIIIGIFIFKQVKARQDILTGMKQIISGDLSYKADTNDLHGDNIELATSVNSIGESVRIAVEKSMKDERMKTDLVANLSHDIRTPLTSIINYVDLIKRENIEDEKIQGYINVLEEKSFRLKTLTDDLIEASKVSSGNVELNLVKMNLPELVNQSLAEFSEKFEEKNLMCVCNSDNLLIPNLLADGKSLWRVIENLLGNVYKYTLPGTRVFLDMFNVETSDKKLIVLQIKNMSEAPLPTDLSELTERFIRGDESRTTEGSGLGLSIAKSLTELMNGQFDISSEADLFKVELSFEAIE